MVTCQLVQPQQPDLNCLRGRGREASSVMSSFDEHVQKELEAKKPRKQLEAVPEILRREALEVPAGPEFEPDLDEFHQEAPTAGVPPIPEATGELEAQEQKAKRRQRMTQTKIPSVQSDAASSSAFCFLAMVDEQFLEGHAKAMLEEMSEYSRRNQ